MNILLLGSGGREHALAWKIAASPLVEKLYCAPGNAGIAQEAEIVTLGLTDHAAVVAFCRANKIDFGSRAELVTNPRVQALYDGIIEELNKSLARFEKLKRVLLLPEELSALDGTLTPTLKVRRRGVEERYRALIDEMYEKAGVGAS